MSKTYRNKTLEDRMADDSVVEDLELVGCKLVNCRAGMRLGPERRCTIRRILLRDCRVAASCGLKGAIVEDCAIDGLALSDPFFSYGTVFSRVRLRGRIGALVIQTEIPENLLTADARRAFSEANRRYYKGIDWAFDLSEGDFVEFSATGIPVDLFRIDPATQAIVRACNATPERLAGLDLSGTYIDLGLQDMRESGDDGAVIVAPRSRRARTCAVIAELRARGVADPA